mmetsp:Transcript_29533/g.67901  ORF Transcript_29533/g.67901 Transcript_29533/m.67901 type:complete len:326 (+) Transcript_29533:742-1719(+)
MGTAGNILQTFLRRPAQVHESLAVIVRPIYFRLTGRNERMSAPSGVDPEPEGVELPRIDARAFQILLRVRPVRALVHLRRIALGRSEAQPRDAHAGPVPRRDSVPALPFYKFQDGRVSSRARHAFQAGLLDELRLGVVVPLRVVVQTEFFRAYRSELVRMVRVENDELVAVERQDPFPPLPPEMPQTLLEKVRLPWNEASPGAYFRILVATVGRGQRFRQVPGLLVPHRHVQAGAPPPIEHAAGVLGALGIHGDDEVQERQDVVVVGEPLREPVVVVAQEEAGRHAPRRVGGVRRGGPPPAPGSGGSGGSGGFVGGQRVIGGGGI